jgi:hypothetical protein
MEMRTMKKVLLGLAVLLVGTALFFGGLFLGQANATDSQVDWMMGSGQQGRRFIGEDGKPIECGYGNVAGMAREPMIGNGFSADACGEGFAGNGFGMMGNAGMMNGYGRMGTGLGMMGGPNIKGNGYGMMNWSHGMMGSATGVMGGPGMMGRFGSVSYVDVDPLSIEDAEAALSEYLASLGDDNLIVGEIMIFDNHAYAQIVNISSDTGAFEVLVDPVTRDVYPEPGPNMMWNTEYGHMSSPSGYSMMGGFAAGAEINVTGEEAVTVAQQYLDSSLPGATADETADTFPGYYTIHVLRDGETIGMLSVNAFTGQVFLHHWHGELIEMAGEEHD